MKRFIKHLLITYVVVISIALVAALPGVLGAPAELPADQTSSDALSSELPEPKVEVLLDSHDSPEEPPDPELTPDGWEIVVPGIEYREFQLPDPNNVYVARLVRSNEDVILESSIAQGKLASGRESVTGMADRYNQTINFWGGEWGPRNHVVVAINGYYFDPSSGLPHRGQIHSTWYAKRFDDLENGSGFVWNADRSVFMGECIRHPADKQFITILKSGKTQLFQGVNVPRGNNQLVVYTPQYDADTNTGDDLKSVEAIVNLSKPAALLKASEMITGTVKSIRKNVGSAPIPFDHIVLSARGTARDELLDADKSNLNEGDVIGITQKISNCVTSPPYEWNITYASIGGHFYFLKDGNIQSYPDNSGATSSHPRTAIAYNTEFVYYIVVDGRDPYASIGMTTDELAIFARDYLNATHGVSEDGGGSSTMVVNGEVKNNTFCNNVFCKSKVFLPLITQPEGTESSAISKGQDQPPILLIPAPSFDPEDDLGVRDDSGVVEMNLRTGTYQRLVANGMLMVVVEPITNTTTFAPGEAITTTVATNIRLGPGTNYAKLGTLDPGTSGRVIDHSNGLNGVFATGYNWWQVNINGLVGWVAEQLLMPPSKSNIIESTTWSRR